MSQVTLTFEQALSRVRDHLNNANSRIIIGIIGKPGAGKSTLSSFLIEKLPPESVVLVPMDGYHLSNKELDSLGCRDRKGAPDTFDSFGYAALLQRIATSTEDVYFPVFHREIEESIAAEGVVTAKTRIVLTEGNYLLHSQDGWKDVAPILTESWYVEVDDVLRLERLVDRHHFYGKERQAAHDWAHGTDENNARLVEGTKKLAEFLVINSDQ
jgi:pantothenate kinase